MTPAKPAQIESLSTEELQSTPTREFIMVGGKDGTGKTNLIVSLAKYVESVTPEAEVLVIDSENKFKSAIQSWGSDAPRNIKYYKVGGMNEITKVTAHIIANHNPGDWLCVESLARVWERAQDLGYQAVAGVDKIEYLERKRADKTIKSPIPRPDDFWAVVKGAHDSAFFDLLTQVEDLNVLCTTTIAKAKQEFGGRKENVDRKALRVELGIDSNLEGAPRLPYYVETLMLLELEGGEFKCRVLRDNLSTAEESRQEFPVPDKKAWATMFYSTCRG